MSSDSVDEGLTAASLEAKWERSIDEAQADFNTRMRRATSWLERAEQEEGDVDAEFIFYWITFNAAYGGDGHTEKQAFKNYFGKVLTQGAGKRVLAQIHR